MFDWLKNIKRQVREYNTSVTKYQKDTIIQSLPTVAYVNKAKGFFDKREYEQAETILKEALDLSKEDPLVYKYLGKIAEIQLRFEEAIEYYDKSARLSPQDKEIWLRLGMSQLGGKQYEESIKSFERADKVTPMNTDVNTGWGMALMKLKKYALARDKYALASKINKYNYTAILLSAVMDVRLKDYNYAQMKLEFLNKVAPTEGSAYEYANLKLINGDYKTAKEWANNAISMNKQILPAYFVLGEVYSYDFDIENVNNVFNRAIDNGLDCGNLRCEWAKAYMRLFDFILAKEQLLACEDLDKDNEECKILLAILCSYERDFNLLENLKEKYFDNIYIQEGLGLKFLAEENYKDAIDTFKKVVSANKKQVYNYYHLAKAHEKLNDSHKTREYYDKFTQEVPLYINGHLEYAKWLMAQGDYSEAQRKLRKAEKIDDKNIDVLNLLFLSSYILVKDSVCDYNVKEALALANKIKEIGIFEYENEYQELISVLENIQRKS